MKAAETIAAMVDRRRALGIVDRRAVPHVARPREADVLSRRIAVLAHRLPGQIACTRARLHMLETGRAAAEWTPSRRRRAIERARARLAEYEARQIAIDRRPLIPPAPR